MQPHERVIAFDLVGLASGDIERLKASGVVGIGIDGGPANRTQSRSV
jgi:hypothetical protein